MAIYSILQSINFVLNETRWFQLLVPDPSATSFLQVLHLLASRALCYLLVQLAARHWPHLRRHLSRVEWRSLLGLTLFVSLADLVFLSGSKVEGRDLLPLGAVQCALFVTSAWRTGTQLVQIAVFRRQLGKTAAPVMVEKRKTYDRYWRYHWMALVVQVLLTMAVAAAMMAGALEYVEAGLVVSLTSQSTLIVYYLFWSLCLSARLLQ